MVSLSRDRVFGCCLRLRLVFCGVAVRLRSGLPARCPGWNLILLKMNRSIRSATRPTTRPHVLPCQIALTVTHTQTHPGHVLITD